MSIIICSDCNNEISDSAIACPRCGKPNQLVQDIQNNKMAENRKVSALLVVGILFMPYIFSWFTLRKGYSTLARVVSLSWLILLIILMRGDNKSSSNKVSTSKNIVSEYIFEKASKKQIAQCKWFLKKGYKCTDEGFAIQSKTFSSAYFVAIKVYGPKCRTGTIGVWSLSGSKNNPGMTFSVNQAAVRYFSETGDIRSLKKVAYGERFPEAEALEKYARKNIK